MEFRILGPLEVVEQDAPLRLGGGKQRALLAVLLLHANEVVSTDRLVEELWGEDRPPTAAKIVQVYVSQLRRLLADGTLLTRRPGYVLRVEPADLDLARFEQLVAEARTSEPAAAAEKLREALALWRGPPLADFAYEQFAQTEIARLEELRLAAVEARIAADLELGRHAELVGELEALVSEHPLRERLRGQLMLALYRCGRQAEALEAYRRGRRLLADELGLEPNVELQELEKAILVQDPSLAPPAALTGPGEPTERPAARGGPVFVGRQRELGELLQGLEDVISGRGRLFLITGEPGIGKSRLADELINHARARGACVLVGRCWEAGGAPAYWPWVQMIRAYAREANPESLRLELGAGAADVAQIVPELRELFPDLPEPVSPESEGARFRLFDSTTAFLRNAAAKRPLVLVLDDLQAADEPSLLLLKFVARELGESSVLLAAAYRDVDPLLRDPLTTALTELVREPITRTLHLTGLDEPNVASFIELTTARMPAQGLASAVYSETEGNPLFVGEIVRLLALEGRLEDPAGPIGIPQSVKEVIGRRLRHLSAECNRILVLASVLGREFDLDVLERLSGSDRESLLEALDEATAARVVSDVPGAIARLRFAHELIRDVVYEALPRARRFQLHREVGEDLEALHEGALEPHLAELAHHFFEAVPGGDARKAITYAGRAGRHATDLLAYEEAVRLYEMALRLLPRDPKSKTAEHCELLIGLGDAQASAGDTRASKHTFREAAVLAQGHGLSQQLARAALGYGGKTIWAVLGTTITT
jgi:DNA-binding SARP family transcriptional activator